MSRPSHLEKMMAALKVLNNGWWLLLFLGIYGLHVWSYLFLNDDAYISFRYAAHWVDYGEVSYNLGERVEGYTNFLWVASLALGRKLGGDIPTLSVILSALCGGLTICLIGSYSARHEKRHPQAAAMLATGLLVLSPSYACWSSGGLEVQLFTLLLTIGSLLSLSAWGEIPQRDDQERESAGKKRREAMAAGACLALAAMTRPEGLLLFGVIGLYRILHLMRARERPSRVEYTAICAFILTYLPYYAWRYSYYGYPLPNTYYAKVGAEALWGPGLRYIGSWLWAHPWLISLPLFALGRLWREKKEKTDSAERTLGHQEIGLTLCCVLALGVHVARVGGDFMALHRFLVPLLPMCALVSAGGVILLFRRYYLRWGRIRMFALSLMIALGLISLSVSEYRWANRIGSERGVDSIGWLRQFSRQCAAVGRYLKESTSPDVRLATTAAGALPYYAERYTVDLLGLNDSWIAHHVPARGHRPGHTKSAPFRYPIDKKVDYLIYHPTFSARAPSPHPDYARALKPHGFQWQSVQVPQLTPPIWSAWVKVRQSALKPTQVEKRAP